ncbi:MATE family efflux transporter [Anaerocolumna sp. MB42-C2]|uniref:MATE family efflux transporter n=1 Tax=Anaerocolumna sp. MB42-C2 TaxID=3070997 RepID=UPI0027E09A6A|nr:MATE family efflux transporter [Anaerocolumna sp. MB42-C2]WMJ86954.1 MATE family efflux transporter [Anaerocolumna sp. MB42-C2]
MKRWFQLDKKADKEIISLAWPSITEQILEMMVGMVSTIFMGRIGIYAVAAVGMVNMLMGFLQTVFSGLSIGTTVIIARVTGEGHNEDAKRALIQSGYMAIIVGVFIAVIGRIISLPLLGLFFGKAEPEVFTAGISYLNIILINLPFLVLDIIVSGAMRGAGDTKTPMIITGGVNILNIILNTVLIFGVPALHIPAFGIVGSAAAVTVSRIIGVTVRVLVLYNFKGLKLNLSLKDDYRIRVDMIKRIINIGIPGFIEQAVMQGGFLVLQIVIVPLGTVAMAAYQIGLNINALAFFPIFGFAIANTTLVGQSLGEGNHEKAETYSHESLKIAMLVAFVIGILMIIFSKLLAGLYSTDSLVIKEAIGIVCTFGVIEPLLAVLNVCSATLKAAGDIKYVMVTSFVGLWTFRVFLSFLLINLLGLGLTAVMIGIFFDFSSRSAMYLIRVKSGKWKLLTV